MKNNIVLKKASPYLLLAPGFIFIVFFMFYPLASVFKMSMQHNLLTDPKNITFIGFENFRTLFNEEVFLKSMLNTFKWVCFNVPIQAVLGMIFAIILNQSFKGRGLARALAFSPWAVSGVIVAIMWTFMYNENFGVFNDFFLKIGLINKRISWFSNGNRALWAMIIAQTWRGVPFFAISFLSGLQSIPMEVYESANLDGAGKIRKFFSITLPMIKDTVVFTVLLRTIWTLNAVDLIYVSTGGGPANNTLTVPVYIMKTFLLELDYGKCCSMAVSMAMFMILFAFSFLKISRYGKEEMY